MPAAAADLAVSGLTVEYSSGGYAARPLDGFDLDVPSGHLVLLRGASGCGKTTVLSVLAGILTPAGGRFGLAAMRVRRLRVRARPNTEPHTWGGVFQAFNLVPSLARRRTS